MSFFLFIFVNMILEQNKKYKILFGNMKKFLYNNLRLSSRHFIYTGRGLQRILIYYLTQINLLT